MSRWCVVVGSLWLLLFAVCVVGQQSAWVYDGPGWIEANMTSEINTEEVNNEL